MDEAVSTTTNMRRSAGLAGARRLAALPAFGVAVVAVVALVGAPARAAEPSVRDLQDPTRPPAAALAPQAGEPAPSALPQLQSVLLGAARGARRIAVIDGESVRVGDSFRGARVLRIADNQVELQRGRERQVLRLDAGDSAAGMHRVAPAATRRDKGEP
jgi:MSHA biogenesis protein MshK